MEAIVSSLSSCLCLVSSSGSTDAAICRFWGASLTALGGGKGHQLETATWKWTSLISAAGFQQLVLLRNQLEPPGPLALFLQGANAIPQLRFRNLPRRIRNRSSLQQGQGSPGWGPSSGASQASQWPWRQRLWTEESGLPVALPASTVLLLAVKNRHPNSKVPRFPFQRVSQVRMWRAH